MRIRLPQPIKRVRFRERISISIPGLEGFETRDLHAEGIMVGALSDISFRRTCGEADHQSPKSALERGEITAAEIEKILASARLTPASVEDRGTSDPRIVLEMPDDIVPTGLPTYFKLEHNRLPLSIKVTLSDPNIYETAKLLNKISAMAWEVGTLARTDEYFYYFIRHATYPTFALGFGAEGMTARIDVSVSKSSSDGGNITKEDIERVLASARVIPASESDKK
jgi:hypothetical protein